MTDTLTGREADGPWARLRRRKVVQWGLAYVAGAWGFLQGLEYVSEAFGWPGHLRQIAILALLIGLPVTLVIAWYHGDRGKQRVSGTELVIITLLFLLGGGIFWRYDRTREAPPSAPQTTGVVASDRSIAVLPFTNLSSDPEQGYLADGLAEELLNLLARNPDLRVISRTSAFSFKGTSPTVAEVAERLKVTHVLEGSVRKSGNQIRVTAQLIDARTDAHVWSETYTRTLDDIFAIQDEIAGHVVEQLKLKLLADGPRARRPNPAAYLLFMEARQLLDAWDPDYARIDRSLRRALEIDPAYADIWTGIAWLYWRCFMIDLQSDVCPSTPDKALRQHDAALARALAIDPDNAVAITYQAFHLAFRHRDLSAAAPGFQRALRLDPTKTDVLRPSMMFARAINRSDLAVRMGEYVISRDPLCAQCVNHLSWAYIDTGRLTDAESLLRNSIATDDGGEQHALGMVLLLKGNAPGALEAFQRLPENAGALRLSGEAMALHTLGRKEQSGAAIMALRRKFADSHAHRIAETYAWIGDMEQASAWLEKALQSPVALNPVLYMILAGPVLKNVLEQARLQPALSEFGLAREQLADIRFEVHLPGE